MQKSLAIRLFKSFIKSNGFHMKNHQIKGYLWCLDKEISNVNIGGGLLCDEMGLGKTILMSSLMKINKKDKTLIVVPTILMSQWISIITKIFKKSPLVYHGNEAKNITFNDVKNHNIVITTYGMISVRSGSADRMFWNSLMWDIKWDRVIYDEAHHMRNRKSNIYKGALRLITNISWLVTGTPIQNKWNDICSLMYLLPYPECKSLFATGNSVDIEEEMLVVFKYLLIRSKKGVGIKMPPKTEEIIKVKFKGQQEKSLALDLHSRLNFTSVTRTNIHKLVKMMEMPISALTRTRQICTYPYMLSNMLDEEEETEEFMKDMPDFMKMKNSKISEVRKKILSEPKNEKKILFCHYKDEINIYKTLFKRAGYKVDNIDGSRTTKDKDKILKNKDLDILLLQIKSGCEGLNLQHFNQVYFTSPHWNPAIEDQAIARVYRIGQQKEVKIFKFVSVFENNRMTIDEYSVLIQDKKREIIASIKKN